MSGGVKDAGVPWIEKANPEYIALMPNNTSSQSFYSMANKTK